jgi:signal transduction histidine kinase
VPLVAALAAEAAGGPALPEAAGDLVAGVALLGCGLVLWARGTPGGAQPSMALAGVAWFAGDIWSGLLYVHRGPLTQLLVTYPAGRLRPRALVPVVAAAYVDGAVPALARSEWPTIALAAALVVTAAARCGAVTGVARRTRAIALAAAAAIGGALALAAAGRLAGWDIGELALWTYFAAVTLSALALAAGLSWGGWARAAVTGLVVDLGDRHERRGLRAALARTLGDRGLEVGYRVAGAGAWVDEHGRPIELPEPATGRRVTVVHDGDEPVAALVHDPAALGDGELARSVAAAARIALANLQMQHEAAARMEEVAASSRRLVETADEERRLLADELRTGPERRLRELTGRLAAAASARDGATADELRRLAGELDDARADLLRFAQGVHPPALTERGLGAALAQLVANAPLDVTLSVADRRFPPAHEAAAFFVCSEALANVAKYAGADHADVSVAADGGRLVVRVADDGSGGADPSRGSGLRGLADRVEALGGALRVHSPPGAGTRLEAELPIGPAGDP